MYTCAVHIRRVWLHGRLIRHQIQNITLLYSTEFSFFRVLAKTSVIKLDCQAQEILWSRQGPWGLDRTGTRPQSGVVNLSVPAPLSLSADVRNTFFLQIYTATQHNRADMSIGHPEATLRDLHRGRFFENLKSRFMFVSQITFCICDLWNVILISHFTNHTSHFTLQNVSCKMEDMKLKMWFMCEGNVKWEMWFEKCEARLYNFGKVICEMWNVKICVKREFNFSKNVPLQPPLSFFLADLPL